MPFNWWRKKSGFTIYLHACPSCIYPMPVLKQLDAALTDLAAAHLTIFVDAPHDNQLWLWVKRQGNRTSAYPTYMDIDFNVLAGNILIGFTSLDEVRRVTQKLVNMGNTDG